MSSNGSANTSNFQSVSMHPFKHISMEGVFQISVHAKLDAMSLLIISLKYHIYKNDIKCIEKKQRK